MTYYDGHKLPKYHYTPFRLDSTNCYIGSGGEVLNIGYNYVVEGGNIVISNANKDISLISTGNKYILLSTGETNEELVEYLRLSEGNILACNNATFIGNHKGETANINEISTSTLTANTIACNYIKTPIPNSNISVVDVPNLILQNTKITGATISDITNYVTANDIRGAGVQAMGPWTWMPTTEKAQLFSLELPNDSNNHFVALWSMQTSLELGENKVYVEFFYGASPGTLYEPYIYRCSVTSGTTNHFDVCAVGIPARTLRFIVYADSNSPVINVESFKMECIPKK